MIGRSLPEPLKRVLRPVRHAAGAGVRTALGGALRGARAILGPRLFVQLAGALAREADTTLSVGGLRLEAAGEIVRHRVETFFSKEPDTLAWIDDFVREGEVFYDVGANIGVFALYAARRGARVFAFEPFAETYAILNRNIFENRLDERIVALNLALDDRDGIDRLNVSAFLAGKAGNAFANDRGGSTYARFAPAFRQGMIGLRLDTLIRRFELPFPAHLKIDVDGNDPRALAGLGDDLRDPRLKTVAIELNPEARPNDRAALERLEAAGFVPLAGERYLNRASRAAGMARNHFFRRPAATIG